MNRGVCSEPNPRHNPFKIVYTKDPTKCYSTEKPQNPIIGFFIVLLSFACLVFGLIGSSLGSKSNLRSSKSQGFGLSVILILIYYVMSFVFSSFGVKGILPPIFAAWFPVLVSLGGGIYFLRKSSSF